MKRIMIIDEEPKLARVIAERLGEEGYRTETYQNSEAIISYLTRSNSFDLVLLGTMQPHSDSVALFRRLRKELSCPIIYLSSHDTHGPGQEPPDIDGSDYFIKPLVLESLTSRIRSHLNDETNIVAKPDGSLQEISNLTIDRKGGVARFNGQRIRLSEREFKLLCYLAENLNEVLTREQISEAVWGEGNLNANVTVHIKNLRDKFDPDNRFIKTIWGVGYMMVSPNLA